MGWLRIRDVWNVVLPLILPLFYQSAPYSFSRASLLPKVRCYGGGSACWIWVFRWGDCWVRAPSVFWPGAHPNTDRWDGQMGTYGSNQSHLCKALVGKQMFHRLKGHTGILLGVGGMGSMNQLYSNLESSFSLFFAVSGHKDGGWTQGHVFQWNVSRVIGLLTHWGRTIMEHILETQACIDIRVSENFWHWYITVGSHCSNKISSVLQIRWLDLYTAGLFLNCIVVDLQCGTTGMWLWDNIWVWS